jgi:hypothetical protein
MNEWFSGWGDTALISGYGFMEEELRTLIFHYACRITVSLKVRFR